MLPDIGSLTTGDIPGNIGNGGRLRQAVRPPPVTHWRASTSAG
ncbi:hypothetical protein [Endozoicomonas atrinae]|nr:hypothetical protein [Endozoicomonas atrinae]